MSLYCDEEEIKYIFPKAYECPVCGKKFHAMTVRTGKARTLRTDRDLRTVFKGVDANKYDVILCNHCGYAAVSKYFGPLAKPHRDMLTQSLSCKFKPFEEKESVISYSEALNRYKMAQINAMFRQAKSSEKALICLKTAWVLRGMKEELEADEPTAVKKIMDIQDEEKRYIESAMCGFLDARQTEMPPIAGMSEVTLDYLLAVLCFECRRFDEAYNLAQQVVLNQQATGHEKDKARDFLAEIKEYL